MSQIDDNIKHYVTPNATNKHAIVELTHTPEEFNKTDEGSNKMYKLGLAEIKDNNDLQNKRICLIDKNFKTKKCPNSWNNATSTTYGYNVCCKNT